MRIGIDGNEANTETRVGVNQYALELLRNIQNLQDIKSGKHSITIFLRDAPLSHMPKETSHFKYKVLYGGSLWIIRKLMPYLWNHHHQFDVFWSPSHYVPPLARIPLVCSIMDLGYLEFSGQFKKYDFWQLKLWSAWSIRVSKTILTISDTSRKDIVRHYPFASSKIVTTLLGYDRERFNTYVTDKDVRRVKEKLTIGSNYLLFLSTLKPSKNVDGLIRAWGHIEKDFPETKLVIAGKKGWFYKQIFSTVEQLELGDRVLFTDFIEEDDKPALIKGAKAFVLPSFWEGFGMDVLSSMACGVPVVISDKGSLPEVAGGVGVFVDPYQDTKVAEGLRKILSMNARDYAKLQKESIKRAREFSWEKTAIETLEAIKR